MAQRIMRLGPDTLPLDLIAAEHLLQPAAPRGKLRRSLLDLDPFARPLPLERSERDKVRPMSHLRPEARAAFGVDRKSAPAIRHHAGYFHADQFVTAQPSSHWRRLRLDDLGGREFIETAPPSPQMEILAVLGALAFFERGLIRKDRCPAETLIAGGQSSELVKCEISPHDLMASPRCPGGRKVLRFAFDPINFAALSPPGRG
ncbi:hypothetical protein [Tardiphaga sp. 841_E9_N1_2]|uniref:hypothetical protein n=1 Tax=Tardiphaga sp. 841_E9_N1_2 TaxID=3240762 RepID=UPI003F209919